MNYEGLMERVSVRNNGNIHLNLLAINLLYILIHKLIHKLKNIYKKETPKSS